MGYGLLGNALARTATIIKSLPNLQNIYLAVNSGHYALVNFTVIFEAVAEASRRSAFAMDIDAPWHCEPIAHDLLRRASMGLRSLDIKWAEELGTSAIRSLLDGSSASLTELSLPWSFFEEPRNDTLHIPRLESLTFLDDKGEAVISPFLSTHPHISDLNISGNVPSVLGAGPSITCLALEAELPAATIQKNISSLPSPGILRELHIALVDTASEFELRDTFSSLPALEELSVSGWFTNTDGSPCVLDFPVSHNHWETIYDKMSLVRSQIGIPSPLIANRYRV